MGWTYTVILLVLFFVECVVYCSLEVATDDQKAWWIASHLNIKWYQLELNQMLNKCWFLRHWERPGWEQHGLEQRPGDGPEHLDQPASVDCFSP